jgi:hypothetical protein
MRELFEIAVVGAIALILTYGFLKFTEYLTKIKNTRP